MSSFTMSPPPPPPPQKPSAGPYSPQAYPNSISPTASSPYAPPPAKRQRLSPDPRSPPNGTPSYLPTSQGTPGGYGMHYGQPSAVQSPYSPGTYSATSPQQSSFNTPQAFSPQPMSIPPQNQQRQFQSSPPPGPASSSQMMPPPPRPHKEEKDKEERIGVEDIGDSLFGSGINLKDEENYLHNTWTNRHSGNESFNTAQSRSFGSSTTSPNNSFKALTQGTSFGSEGKDGVFAGSLGQAASQESIDAEVRRKREAAARSKAEYDQYHLNNQFLLGNCLRHRMHQRAYENGVKLDVQGIYLRKPDPQVRVTVKEDGSVGLAALEAESLIESGALYEHILSLVSVATCERLRGLVGESYGLSRARRYGDHGLVPPDFADIATGSGKRQEESLVPENITNTQWDKVADGNGDDSEAPADSQEKNTPQPMQTISFQGTLNGRLREVADRDKVAEKERAKRRQSRKRKADGTAPGDDAATSESAGETPAAPAETPAPPPVKMTKKEAIRKAKESANAEAQMFNQSNQTAAMMALGKKGNRYSWMSGGASNMPTNRFAKQTPAGGVNAVGAGTAATKAETPVSGTATPAAPAVGSNPAAAKAAKAEERPLTWGDWQEDQGIQLRDWAHVLQRDGRDQKALYMALNKLKELYTYGEIGKKGK